MRKIGTWQGHDVGCFVLLRGEEHVPVFTVHRVARHLAQAFALQLERLNGGLVYDVVGVESVCDCQGALQLEP